MLGELIRAFTGQQIEQSPISEEERQFRLKKALAQGIKITNSHVWLAVVEKAGSRKGKDGLSERELGSMLEVYKVDIPVAELVLVASEGSFDLSRDQLLSRVCFNYPDDAERLERSVNESFMSMIRMHYVNNDEFFNRNTQTPERITTIRDIVDDVRQWVSWLRRDFSKGVFPLLMPDEIVKPGMGLEYAGFEEDPTVIKCSTQLSIAQA